MEKAGIAEAGLFFFGEGTGFEGVVTRDLAERRAALEGEKTVRADAIVAAVQRSDAGRDQFLIPAAQRALGHERFEEGCDPQNEIGYAGERLEHIGHDAAVGQQLVVEGSDLRRNLVALQ